MDRGTRVRPRARGRQSGHPAYVDLEVPREELDLQQQQVLRDRLLRRHVGHAGQRQHRVRPTGLGQALREPQRVRGDHVVVRESVDQQQGPRQRRRVVEQCATPIDGLVVLRKAEIALGVEGVVQRPVGDMVRLRSPPKRRLGDEAPRARPASRQRTSPGCRPGSDRGPVRARRRPAVHQPGRRGPASRSRDRSRAPMRGRGQACRGHRQRGPQTLIGKPLRLQPRAPRGQHPLRMRPAVRIDQDRQRGAGSMVARQHQTCGEPARTELSMRTVGVSDGTTACEASVAGCRRGVDHRAGAVRPQSRRADRPSWRRRPPRDARRALASGTRGRRHSTDRPRLASGRAADAVNTTASLSNTRDRPHVQLGWRDRGRLRPEVELHRQPTAIRTTWSPSQAGTPAYSSTQQSSLSSCSTSVRPVAVSTPRTATVRWSRLTTVQQRCASWLP